MHILTGFRVLIIYVGFFLFIANPSMHVVLAQTVPAQCIDRQSSAILAWADSAMLLRGYQDIRAPSVGLATIGGLSDVFGKPDGKVLSLGEGGEIVFHLKNSVYDGDGLDFVVFENGFLMADDNQRGFLELASVSVSSDGNFFLAFPIKTKEIQPQQLNTFDTAELGYYENAAGNCVSPFGTAFDLKDLPSDIRLDKQHIKYIKITDIKGNIADSLCVRDTDGNCVNDPWPTPYASSGFDLDALGFIHMQGETSASEPVFVPDYAPIPSVLKPSMHLHISHNTEAIYCFTSLDGKQFPCDSYSDGLFKIPNLPDGLYLLTIQTSNYARYQKVRISVD